MRIHTSLLALLLATTTSSTSSAQTLCQRLLSQRTRLNSPVLPPDDTKFHAWYPGERLSDEQASLGALEFYSPEIGFFAIQTVAGLNEDLPRSQRRSLAQIVELTPFAGFVSEEEFRNLLVNQPIPPAVKNQLAARGLVHFVKLLPERYVLFNAQRTSEYLRQSLSPEALENLLLQLDRIELLFDRTHLTIDSPLLMVSENGRALLYNLEAARERKWREPRLRLWREREIVESALARH